MSVTWEMILGAFIKVAFAGLAGYYYHIARSSLSKLFVFAILLISINGIIGRFGSPVEINIIFYIYQLLDVVLSVLLVFLFYRLYKVSLARARL